MRWASSKERSESAPEPPEASAGHWHCNWPKPGWILVLNARDAALLNDLASDCRNLGMRPIAFSGTAADITTASKLVKAAHDLGLYHGFIQVVEVQHPWPFLWELSKARFLESSAASMTARY
jgi:hypothetical protein